MGAIHYFTYGGLTFTIDINVLTLMTFRGGLCGMPVDVLSLIKNTSLDHRDGIYRSSA